VDITDFRHPYIKRLAGKHFHSLTQKALPSVVFGVIVMAGEVKGKRTSLLRRIVRCESRVEKVAFRRQLLKKAKAYLLLDQVLVIDAKFEISELHEEEIERFVLRMATKSTARRNQLPTYNGKGCKPKYGKIVRPLLQEFKGKKIAASQPDHESKFTYDGR
jgi:hypothetical protein